MMKTIRKALSLALAVLFLFAGCSEAARPAESPAAEPTAAPQPEEIVPEEEEDAIPAPDIPEDADFGGAAFTVIYPNWSLYEFYLNAEELNGDVINDAMVNRTEAVNERLGVDIRFVTKGYIDTILAEVKSAVTAGDSSYDLAVTHCINGLQGLLTENLVYDWNVIPYVDLSKPYWNQSILEMLTIGGVTPFAASDMLIADPNVIWFNNDIATDANIGNIYDTVLDGTWTLDTMAEMSDKVIRDLNGDGKMNAKDQYGIIGNDGWPMISFMYGCDQFVAEFVDGVPQVALQTERAANVIEKLYKLLCEGERAYFNSSVNDRYIPFETYHALFYYMSLSSMEQYRTTEVDYGIIPFPKYDEEQADYVSLNWTGLQCVPVSCRDREMVGMVSEELGYESKKQVLPAYFDYLLDGKIARHEETRRMLDIIFETSVYDFGMNFSNQSNFLYILPDLMKAKSTDLASYIKKNLKMTTKVYERVIRGYENLGRE
ncbi:MAG: hypothetical protein II557_04215 [Clostridia bacterium]|nr:hypothetical protein [Clostridia bacterium]